VVTVAAVRIIRRRNEYRLQARLATVGAAAFGAEVLLGAANVWTDLNAAFVTAHLALGALIWTSFVSVAVVSHPVVDAAGRSRTHRAQPVLEGAR
jgi:heme A synthase